MKKDFDDIRDQTYNQVYHRVNRLIYDLTSNLDAANLIEYEIEDHTRFVVWSKIWDLIEYDERFR